MVSAVSASSWRFRGARRVHGPVSPSQLKRLSVTRAVQLARASSVPAGWNSRGIGRGVRGFKLVMVSVIRYTPTGLTI